MQFPLNAIAQDSVQQIRDTMRRVKGLQAKHSAPQVERRKKPRGKVQEPKPDVEAWEDTEIDVRRVML